jgi:hypothetical protein
LLGALKPKEKVQHRKVLRELQLFWRRIARGQ